MTLKTSIVFISMTCAGVSTFVYPWYKIDIPCFHDNIQKGNHIQKYTIICYIPGLMHANFGVFMSQTRRLLDCLLSLVQSSAGTRICG